MSRRTGAWLAWSLWGVVMVLAVASFALRLWNGTAGPSRSDMEELANVLYWMVLIPATVPAYASVGAIVAWRRPENKVGWLCLAFGLVIALEDIAWQYTQRAYEAAPGSLPAGPLAAWVLAWISALMFPPLPFTLILLVFPNGRLLSRRWLLAVWFAVGGAGTGVLAEILKPTLYAGMVTTIANPTGIAALGEVTRTAEMAGGVAAALALLAAGVSVVLRWRQAGGQERQQLKWLAYMAAVVIVAGFGAIAGGLVLEEWSYLMALVGAVALAGMSIGIPVAIGIAILRHRLYDIDVIINRTLVYGALTTMLAIVYFGSVVAL